MEPKKQAKSRHRRASPETIRKACERLARTAKAEKAKALFAEAEGTLWERIGYNLEQIGTKGLGTRARALRLPQERLSPEKGPTDPTQLKVAEKAAGGFTEQIGCFATQRTKSLFGSKNR